MVDDQIEDDFHISLCCLSDQAFHIRHRPIGGVDRIVIGHIILVIRRGGMDGHHPDRIASQVGDIIEL